MSGNVYLVGFMGTGKSAVGRRLARALRRPFVDTDAQIERRAGAPVSEIFERKGERAFRALETRAIQEVARRARVVVALGGGALLSAANRRALARSGALVALTCCERELWRRLSRRLGSRPLLKKGRPEFVALRRKRRGLERGAALRLSTSGRSAAAVAADAARRLKQRGLA